MRKTKQAEIEALRANNDYLRTQVRALEDQVAELRKRPSQVNVQDEIAKLTSELAKDYCHVHGVKSVTKDQLHNWIGAPR